jgi:hypothetical protein
VRALAITVLVALVVAMGGAFAYLIASAVDQEECET